MEKIKIVTTDSIYDCQDGAEVQITAVLKELRVKETKQAGKMAIARFVGKQGDIDVIIWPKDYLASKEFLTEGTAVTIQGQVDDGRPESSFKIKAGRIFRPV